MRLFLLSLFAAFALPCTAVAEEPLRFGTFPNTQSPTLSICEQILREAYATLGYQIEIEHLPGNRSVYWAQTGRLDGELCRGQNFPALIKVDYPLTVSKLTAFSTRKLPITQWADLKNYRVNYERSMKIIELHSAKLNLKMIPANSLPSALRQLQKNRVDVHLNDHNSVLFMARQLGMDNLIANQPVIQTAPVYHQLNGKHLELAEPLAKELQRMDSTGRLREIEQEIMNEYLQRPAPPADADPAR